MTAVTCSSRRDKLIFWGGPTPALVFSSPLQVNLTFVISRETLTNLIVWHFGPLYVLPARVEISAAFVMHFWLGNCPRDNGARSFSCFVRVAHVDMYLQQRMEHVTLAQLAVEVTPQFPAKTPTHISGLQTW